MGLPRRISSAALLSALVISLVMPASPAVAAPSIAFINPSGYTDPPPVISDVTDMDNNVHLVAWTKETPPQALVEFELQPTGQNPATFTATRVSPDAWETFVPLPDSYADGTNYTLRARLYRGVPGNADEVANADMTVEINQSEVPPPIAETVELAYPDNGGTLGIFRPKDKRPNALLDYQASVGTERVRAFYTLSQPGATPQWETCGNSVPTDDGAGRVRCTLSEGHAPNGVTAVAMVSNKTSPSAPPNPQLDDSGDAHRVYPYLQKPDAVEVESASKSPSRTCSVVRAVVTDQFARPIAGANVDVHAKGPTDRLRFASSPGQTNPFKPPDVAHALKESAKRCSDNSDFRRQADHNAAGPDSKHIESEKGTTNAGAFAFGLRSRSVGETSGRVWVDRNDDDDRDDGESSRKLGLLWTDS